MTEPHYEIKDFIIPIGGLSNYFKRDDPKKYPRQSSVREYFMDMGLVAYHVLVLPTIAVLAFTAAVSAVYSGLEAILH